MKMKVMITGKASAHTRRALSRASESTQFFRLASIAAPLCLVAQGATGDLEEDVVQGGRLGKHAPV